MNNVERQRTSGYAGLTAFLLLATGVAQGCGGDENPAPGTPVVTGGTSTGGSSSGGKGGKGGKGGTGATDGGSDSAGGAETGGTSSTSGGTGGGSSASGGKGGTGGKGGGTGGKGGTGGTGNTGNDAGTGNEAGTGPGPSCEPQGDYGCYPCAPETDEQFLNRCNDSRCSFFDNEAKIQGYTGTLPPLI